MSVAYLFRMVRAGRLPRRTGRFFIDSELRPRDHVTSWRSVQAQWQGALRQQADSLGQRAS